MFSFTGMYSAYYIGFPGMYSVFFLFVCLVLLFLYDLFHTVIQSRNKSKFEFEFELTKYLFHFYHAKLFLLDFIM